MKIVLFGLPYSPNLGDGVIAECLAHGLRRAAPQAEVVAIDISGRHTFGAVTVRGRRRALRLLARLPAPLRRQLVRRRLKAMLRPALDDWRHALAGADLAVIGGGQLFSDADLNFPTKIALVARLAGAAGVPVAVHAAGVSANWSRPGAALFSRLFEDCELRAVGLRDAGSIDAWRTQTGGRGPRPTLAPDPGLLAAECYGTAGPRGTAIGVGVSDPALLAYHADAPVAGTAGRAGADFFPGLAVALAEAGRPVVLFCNGAEEDRATLAAVAARPECRELIAAGRLTVAPPPRRPAELSALLAGLGGVVAHRLHACILAEAHGVPAIGLGWDSKVEAFLASIGARDRFVPGTGACDPWSVAARACAAAEAGCDPDARRRAIASCQAAITALAALAAPARPPPPDREA